MKDNNIFSKFIQKGDFSQENIDVIKEYYNISDKQLVKKTFKYLNAEIGIIEPNSFFELAISKGVDFLCKICNDIEFSEEEIVLHNAYISYALYLARFNKTFEFDNKNITTLIDELKKITFEPKNQLYSLLEKLNKYGIKLILLPNMKDLKITSFTRFNPEDNNVVIGISLHSLDAFDIWYKLHEEISHTYKIHSKLLSITYDDKIDDSTRKFADCTLINTDAYDYFVSLHDFDSKAVDIFSKKINTANISLATTLLVTSCFSLYS